MSDFQKYDGLIQNSTTTTEATLDSEAQYLGDTGSRALRCHQGSFLLSTWGDVIIFGKKRLV